MIRTAIICVAVFLNIVLCYDISTDCIASHNKARRIDTSPDIAYNSSVCKHAEKRAKELADNCKFDHNGNSGSGYGENLGAGSQYGCAESMKMWLDEKKNIVMRN
ncbi:type-1 pathogenesis-related protein-like protein [Leptotrombidium deliense]|uniref:Type-1 pathogenesis-related protein-like protein n=1 Tax=Leptotrombidium deliense TaxID=299467 RepID=A0A443RSL2_9ACAR|nr:type-1 pathogenesis-related protein-like protein [Leptotrombidium deliense]